MSDRLSLVQNELITPRVLQRFSLRKTGSSTILRQCAGEIAKQVYNILAPEAGFYVNIDLVVEEVDARSEVLNFLPAAISTLFGKQPERKRIVLTCDESDLDTLIDTLTNLRDRLKEQLKAEAKENDPS
jgi:hypothetical protein